MTEHTSQDSVSAGEQESPSDSELRRLSPFELKDELIQVADEAVKTRAAVMLNAGRGNPNWIATTPREAFFLLGQFALAESRRVWNEPGVGLSGMPRSPGIARRLHDFLNASDDDAAVQLLRDALDYGESTLRFNPDRFVWELTDAVIGDNYPVPDRMLVHAERIVQEYLARELFADRPPPGRFDLFAVEGGTAAMTYIFRSLMVNGLLQKGDTIALGAPIFTPYLGIPHLEEFSLHTVDIQQSAQTKDGVRTWQYPDAELRKLEDPRIKAFFVVNPSNPGAVAIQQESVDRLVELVRTRRPDLLILTDDVYGTFVNGFRSLAADLPRNTLLVYSYSKHFGCTGWRLGVVALHEDNILDEALARQPPARRARMEERYGSITLNPGKLKFIDRMVADSRAVALNHTAGLSLPQQLQMTLFSLFSLLDPGDFYKKRCQRICQDRLEALFEGLGVPLREDPLRTAYYQTLDLEAWCREHIGEDFVRFVEEHHDPLDIVFTLARRHGVVLLNGSGFGGPPWSARVSLANLEDDEYPRIGKDLQDVVRRAIDEWMKAGGVLPPELH
ncbi:bifunctional aspartate transaminase/aspartate 4-decarboxylase [Corallococcus praedator]|uniref:Bifunctional aspartate transaminase/aspartate 4-decarboxylase n=1 Tax=Corallococcus praedator TaxID=2316724 RepID=A0ABX9QFB2_9BACT|nr:MULTISPECIES: bifunctional aspartate transaminase/aspartate 4-decarboxylase [Corallococcus]RKH33770.1 bifunctional aspartate transaminase/aspartate 4-decarboxylase [Corallococcus sp. CA031C]RKI06339.1 bifunctional aspartate transaminase/aspartate 4-decarboxylase [Corallococcus praedator]